MAIKFTQVVDVANQRITSVASPTLDTDAANKIYVDNVAMGLNWKQAARAASTGNVNLASPGATLDGVTLANNDRILLMNQTDGTENGVYVFHGATSALTRATDSDTSAEMAPGAVLSISEGSVNGDKTFILVTDGPITLGTTPLVFSLMNGGSGTTYTAGNGISLTGGAVAVNTATGGGLIAAPAGLSLDPAVAVRKFAMNVGDGSATTISVAHGLNTFDVQVELYVNGGAHETVYAEVSRTDVNTVSLTFGAAPASAAYRVVIHG